MLIQVLTGLAIAVGIVIFAYVADRMSDRQLKVMFVSAVTVLLGIIVWGLMF